MHVLRFGFSGCQDICSLFGGFFQADISVVPPVAPVVVADNIKVATKVGILQM